MKKDYYKEYIRKLNDEDVKFLHTRLTQRLAGDVAEAVECLQKNHEIDKWFASAANADEFFNIVDKIDAFIQIEAKKRFYPQLIDKK